MYLEGFTDIEGFEGVCVDGTHSGYCTDENGEVSPNDYLPVDVCGDGSYRAPCYPQEKPPHPLETVQRVELTDLVPGAYYDDVDEGYYVYYVYY